MHRHGNTAAHGITAAHSGSTATRGGSAASSGRPAARGAGRVTAAQMPRHAAGLLRALAVRRSVTAHGPLPLDYSIASLRVVDFLIDGLRRDGDTRAETPPPLLFGLGSYVGEVLVRQAGAEWVDLDASQREYFGQRVGVRMPDGRIRSPLSTVENRYRLGPSESLYDFYLTLPGRSRARRVRA
ncbi:hypothetical protein ACFW96_18470 [Streptomyces gardneri]|uniref:hypothetical protein n=1 Tax=Streptomyces gardneri TaxID=66892 RepID=UPI0036CFF535